MAEIDCFYSAHSAFAWLGSARLRQIAEASGRRIRHRPMNLTPVVEAVAAPFQARSAAHMAHYFGRELARWAEWRGVAWLGRTPESHRADYLAANREIIAAQARGWDADALSHGLLGAHWREGADLSDAGLRAEVARAAGIDPVALAEAAAAPEVEAEHRANTDAALAWPMFGSPTYVVDGDMFYGQDRLEMVERALSRPFAR